MSLNLPAGKFVVFGKTNPSTNGDATICTLNRGGVELDRAGVGLASNGGYSLMLTLEGTLSIANPDTVSINCTGEQTAFSKIEAIAVDAIN